MIGFSNIDGNASCDYAYGFRFDVRADLLRGDDLYLYLGWLRCAQNEELEPATPPTRDDLIAWIRTMPVKDKNALLVDAALNINGQAGAEVLGRFEMSRKDPHSTQQPKRRRVGEPSKGVRSGMPRKHEPGISISWPNVRKPRGRT